MTKAEYYINVKLNGAGCPQTVLEEFEAILNSVHGTLRKSTNSITKAIWLETVLI